MRELSDQKTHKEICTISEMNRHRGMSGRGGTTELSGKDHELYTSATPVKVITGAWKPRAQREEQPIPHTPEPVGSTINKIFAPNPDAIQIIFAAHQLRENTIAQQLEAAPARVSTCSKEIMAEAAKIGVKEHRQAV